MPSFLTAGDTPIGTIGCSAEGCEETANLSAVLVDEGHGSGVKLRACLCILHGDWFHREGLSERLNVHRLRKGA